jgi:hypothetical protein
MEANNPEREKSDARCLVYKYKPLLNRTSWLPTLHSPVPQRRLSKHWWMITTRVSYIQVAGLPEETQGWNVKERHMALKVQMSQLL